MMEKVDNFLGNITMYRLVVYYLILLLLAAFVLSSLKIMALNPFALLFSTLFIVAVSYAANIIFSATFEVITNTESFLISALILALIITPSISFASLIFFGWASVWTMASKYLFTFHRKHLFNPVAFALVLTSLGLGQAASWWVGTLSMLPFVLLGGLLIVRKIRRFSLALSFLIASLGIIIFGTVIKGGDLAAIISESLLYSPLFFFAFVMLTEPLTTPPTRKLQMVYGGLVGILFSPQIHFGSFYTTPEISLLIGNFFSYLVGSKDRLVLKLKEKVQLGPDIYDFIFKPDSPFHYRAGQYLEWTADVKKADTRGNRRYFTLSSSPTEEDIAIGVKFSPTSSRFKKTLLSLSKDDKIIAEQLSGDFVLPKNPNLKLAFIAGGIGITPFRSMVKYLLDNEQKRDVALFYSNKLVSDIVYRDVFEQAQKEMGMKTIYALTDLEKVPKGWSGYKGFITEEIIKKGVPDYKERVFYLSGPHSMVTTFEKVLAKMGVPLTQIKTDYFPGYS